MPIDSIAEKTAPVQSNGRGQRKIDEEKLKKACRDFEAIFIQQLLKGMRKTVPESELFGKGPEKEIFQSLFDEEWSRSLAQQGGVGIGKMLFRQVHPPEAREDLPSIDFKEPPKSKEVNLRRKEE